MKGKFAISLLITGIVFWGVEFCAFACGFEEYREINYSKEMVQAMNAVFKARTELGLEKGDEKLLALTNAGYGTVNGKTTEAFLDIVSNVTACTLGTRSLLLVHTPFTEPLWCALYRKDNGRMIFVKWIKNRFEQENLDISPDKILSPDAWKKGASGIIGDKTLFSLVTISHCWSAGASWQLLKTAEFHNHICPGLNTGCIIGQYLKKRHPLRKGENYLFIGAPPGCVIDALQIIFDATVGKNGTFGKGMSKEKIEKYSEGLWFEGVPIPPLAVIAMRVNKKSNSCEGVVLGVDWKSIFADAGQDYRNLTPPGGKTNPLYFISRAKVSVKIVSMTMSEKLKYVKEIKKFFGQAAMARKLTNEGIDPYAVIWDFVGPEPKPL
jgi:formylmethanofuran dehydrogenase subunit E-like metal-binding protein